MSVIDKWLSDKLFTPNAEGTPLTEIETPASMSGHEAGDTPPQRNRPRLIGQIITIAIFRLVLNTARRFIYPFAPALGRELHVPLTAVTSLIALNQTTGLLGLAAGPLADRWGNRKMMRTGLGLLAAGMLLCTIAPLYGYVLTGLLLAGLGKTVFDPAVLSFIGHRVPFARRGMAIGAIETAWAGSTFIGIPIIAVIIDQFGLRWSFLAMAIFGAAGYVLLARMIPKDTLKGVDDGRAIGILAALGQLIRMRPAAGMMGFAFWMSMANDNLFVVYGAWLERDFAVGLLALGLSTSVIGAAELTGESCTAIWSDRLGIKRAVTIGLILAILSYAALPLIGRSMQAALAGLFLIFLFFEFTIVSSFSLCTELLPNSRATMMAGFYAAAALGRIVGALTGTPLWLTGGLPAVALSSAMASLLGLLCFLWGIRHWKS
jgi:predicted MFS family arabinose efflux permease